MGRARVVVLGVDGYLGWATALHLSKAGHDVVGIDSLVRRRWDRECGTQSLIPIKSMPQRVALWKRLTGRTIGWRPMDLCDARAVTELVQDIQPDAHNIKFPCRIWALRATNLRHGVVYGNHTAEVAMHPELATRFDYDAIWGTVLNRFCIQAALGLPLTVYGKGGQTRGFLDIRDTVACVRLALEHPAAKGEYRVFNQFTEQFSVKALAEKVIEARAARGLKTSLLHLPNRRGEREEHCTYARRQNLLGRRLPPHYRGDTWLASVSASAQQHAARVDPIELEQPNVDWRRGGTAAWRTPVESAPRPVVLVSPNSRPRRPLRSADPTRASQRR